MFEKRIINFQFSIINLIIRLIQGFIKEIGAPRAWDTKEGNKMETYPLVLTIPFIGHDGKERADDIMAELNVGNPEYIANVKAQKEANKRMEFRCGFSVKNYERNGEAKRFQKCQVHDIQIMM